MSPQLAAILEWVAAGFGVLNVGLLVRRSVWNYPFGMAMVACYVFVFWSQKLYAEAGLQVFFFAAQAWGWWLWQRTLTREHEHGQVPVRWLDGWSRTVWAVATLAVALNLGLVLNRFTDAALPFADAAVTGASVTAQILLAFRRVENWVVWILVDVVAVGLYLNRGLYPTAVIYALMLVLSVLGLVEWVRAARKDTVAA
ncbi:nicotinamide mononucleotide transporter [Novosphingobium profundi]|uniref:nicotinamide riboside transporter PnuC n=1 Tax=Novosphingobium profundi TaxID=1774954 RepID=UPI001BD96523|nr:nicotinamide riboside transporter PnuC [Novosphingobium profundi]MBT0670317.1 nicotinamide mononucleotide transporter [Novosphingobium profundi]